MTHQFTLIPTPIGTLCALYTAGVLCHIALGNECDCLARFNHQTGSNPIRADADAELIACSKQISRLFTEHTPYSEPISLAGLTPFQKGVLQITAQIPIGDVRSYGFIAHAMGKPQASRAVGSALAKNPLPFVIPCHRVIRGDGVLGAYSAGGTAIKARLLEWEGVKLKTGDKLSVATPFEPAFKTL